MTALALTLQKASLQKKDLKLELEELEAAARMVAEDEEERGPSGSAAISCSDNSSTSSDSSSSSSGSSSSDESEESEDDGESCTDTNEGGGGGELCKDNPLQPQPRSAASPIPQEPRSTFSSSAQPAARKVDTLPSAPVGPRQLIQELGELKISQGSSDAAERSRSKPNGGAATTEVTCEGRSGGTLLEPSPRINPLLIVQPQEEL